MGIIGRVIGKGSCWVLDNDFKTHLNIKKMRESDFNYNNACKVIINDGSIKCIWFENCQAQEIDEDNSLSLSDGECALIEFTNGKKMLITNSEWCSLNWV